MSLPTQKNPSPRPTGEFKRLLSRAETLILIGMALCIASLFLPWISPLNIPAGVAPALYKNVVVTRSGSAMPGIRWPLTISSILSGLLLAFNVSPSTKMSLAIVQGLCGIVCFVTALLHFGLQSGPLFAFVGGSLLTFGAFDRFAQEK